MTILETAKKWYGMGLWSEEMLRGLVNKGKLTQEEYDEITSAQV